MANLSTAEIAGYAQAAGFQGNDLAIAVAIAMAESGGNPKITNHNTNGSMDFGLWQINTVHPELLQSGSWSNPADNARMAYTLYHNRRGFKDWAAFNNGSYLAFLGKASVTAPMAVQTENVEESTPGISLNRITLGLVGGIALLYSLYKMSGSHAIGNAISTAGKVAVLA